MSESEPDPGAGFLAVVLVTPAPPVSPAQKALASVYAFGKAPPHFMNWVINCGGASVPSLSHASEHPVVQQPHGNGDATVECDEL